MKRGRRPPPARARRPSAFPPPARRAQAAAEPREPLPSPAVSREGPGREAAAPRRQLFRAGLVGGVRVRPAGPPALCEREGAQPLGVGGTAETVPLVAVAVESRGAPYGAGEGRPRLNPLSRSGGPKRSMRAGGEGRFQGDCGRSKWARGWRLAGRVCT